MCDIDHKSYGSADNYKYSYHIYLGDVVVQSVVIITNVVSSHCEVYSALVVDVTHKRPQELRFRSYAYNVCEIYSTPVTTN
jgi:hypothetical protein